MFIIELFSLFGSIFVDNNEANQSITDTDKKAGGVANTLSTGIGTAAKWGAGLALAAGGAALAVGGLAVSVSEDLQKSLNGLQASTGVSTESMAGMKDAMLEIYNNNFGESFEDIGKAMASIGQQTGLSGKDLSNLTQNALALRDTFEFEVNESVRSANMLMQQFGLDGQTAYNLIAQGAQSGLDKNGDLLDTINEYSVHFQQMGFNSEEMFNMLANGAEAGTFSVDKLGDAVKEFGIRSKDGSKTSSEAFALLGLDAGALTSQFAQGGETANKAFELVTQKIIGMKDPVAQNTAGVALFGTQFEDLGVKGIESLLKVEGEITKTKDSLGQINAIKYNTFGEAITGIKRQLETSILIPIGEMILPILNKFAAWLSEKMPFIKELFNTALSLASEKFEALSKVVDSDVSPVFKTITEKVIPPLIKLFNDIYKIYLPELMKVVEVIFPFIKTIIQTAFEIIANYVLPPLIDIFTFLYTEVFPKVLQIVQQVVPKIQTLWENLWVILEPLLWSLKKTFDLIFPYVKILVMVILEDLGKGINNFMDVLNAIVGFIAGIFKTNWGNVWKDISGLFTGVFKSMVESGKSLINQLIGYLNKGIGAMNKLAFSVPDWVPNIGGKKFSLGIKEIPMLANGGTIKQSGSVLVGERGPEFLNLPRGASVTPLTKQASGITININGATIMNDKDADKLGEMLVGKLRALGVTP